VAPVPKNIYGATKTAAEDLCQLFHRNHGLACLVLRVSRFFPEGDDSAARRDAFADANLKLIELLYRRVDIEDVVGAHVDAMLRAQQLGFGKFIISATSPFDRDDLAQLRGQASTVLQERVPAFEAVFKARGWAMLEDIDRIYVNEHARTLLGWQPKYDFARALHDLANGRDSRSPLAREIGAKGYHRTALSNPG
jgi:UDP-glucose 4-epimerase